jgi:hypothetical protein
MQLITKLTAAGAAAVGIVAGGVALSPAHADSLDSRAVTVRLLDRSDSGEDGNTWAKDDITRQVTITQVSPGAYDVKVRDQGTFRSIVGQMTPGSDDGQAVFAKSVNGQVRGEFTAHITASPDFATFDRSALAGGPIVGDSPSSSTMLNGLFSDGSVSDAFATWRFEYTKGGQHWVNADSANSGNITG